MAIKGISFFIFIIILFILIYIIRPNKDRETTYSTTFILIFFGLFLIFMFISVAKTLTLPGYILFFLFFLSFFFSYKIKVHLKNRNKLMAKQISFWDFPIEEVLEKYSNRIEQKEGRKEIKTILQSSFYSIDKNGEKVLKPNILQSIHNYKSFTKIKSVDEYFNSKEVTRLHTLLFEKLKFLNKRNEANIDFEKCLKDNNYILQFFFIELYEKLTKNISLGVSNLKAIATTKKEKELVGALYCVEYEPQRVGLELFSHYLHFKGTIRGMI